MRKTVLCILLCVCIVFAGGCTKKEYENGSILLEEGTVTEISVIMGGSRQPDCYRGENAQKILDCIQSLRLFKDYPEEENPNNHSLLGGYSIKIEYKDGSVIELGLWNCYWGDFICRAGKEGSCWYKIGEEKGDQLCSLIS